MKSSRSRLPLLAVGALALALVPAARAQLIITEVMSTGSSNATYSADWFELTNMGASAVNLTGYAMDDNTHAFANAVALRGVTSIAAGQSVVFLEGDAIGSNDATKQASFITAWFGGSAPSGFVIGGYGGTQVSLSSSADEVNLFDGGGSFVTGVGFSTAPSGASFDNHASTNPGALLSVPVLSAPSVLGQFGAFTSADATAIGSPGVIANAAAIPEPTACAALFGALALAGTAWFRRRAVSAA